MRPIYNSKSGSANNPKKSSRSSTSSSVLTSTTTSDVDSRSELIDAVTQTTTTTTLMSSSTSGGGGVGSGGGDWLATVVIGKEDNGQVKEEVDPENYSYANIRRFFNNGCVDETTYDPTGLEEHLYDRIDFKQTKRLLKSGINQTRNLIYRVFFLLFGCI